MPARATARVVAALARLSPWAAGSGCAARSVSQEPAPSYVEGSALVPLEALLKNLQELPAHDADRSVSLGECLGDALRRWVARDGVGPKDSGKREAIEASTIEAGDERSGDELLADIRVFFRRRCNEGHDAAVSLRFVRILGEHKSSQLFLVWTELDRGELFRDGRSP